jgi:DNA repair exonuclease SbcCD ATPase subunit
MEPLIFKIETQADDSGVRRFDKSVGGLDSSAKKASAALGSFSRDLLNARSGADVAAAGADALSRVLQKSLAGAVVIGGIKIVADQIEQMAQIIRSAGEATGAAVTQLERMGEVRGIEDAAKAVGILDGSLEAVTKQLGGIQSGNWFTQLIDGATGTSKELKEQIITLERLRDGQIALGFAAERSSAERIQGLTDEQKQYDAIDQRLNKRLELADKISNQSLKAAAIQDANALAEIEKRNLTIKLTEEQGKKEADLATQREKDAAAQLVAMEKIREAQQKRFNELYDAEIKSQEQMQKRIDAELKAEEAKAARGQELQQNLAQAQESQKQNAAGQASSIAGSMSGGSASRGGGRKTSYEVGLEKAQEREFQKGRTEAADAEMQRKIDQIKQERAAVGDTRFTGRTDAMNRMAEEALAAAEAQGKASLGTNEMAESVQKAQTELSNFSKEVPKATLDYGSELGRGMSELAPEFDKAQRGVDNFSEGLTENSGNMIDDFLKTGRESDQLGQDFDATGGEVEKFGEAVKKASPPPGQDPSKGRGKKADDPLTKIHTLLEKNLEEMRTYALVK